MAKKQISKVVEHLNEYEGVDGLKKLMQAVAKHEALGSKVSFDLKTVDDYGNSRAVGELTVTRLETDAEEAHRERQERLKIQGVETYERAELARLQAKYKETAQ